MWTSSLEPYSSRIWAETPNKLPQSWKLLTKILSAQGLPRPANSISSSSLQLRSFGEVALLLESDTTMMPAHSAQVLGLLSLEDNPASQFRPYDGKMRKFYRPKKQKATLESRVKPPRTHLESNSSSQKVAQVAPDDEVVEVPPLTGQERSLLPVGQTSYRQSRYGTLKPNRQLRSPVLSYAEPGRQSDPFKVFPIAYKDCVPDACQFC